MPIVGDMSIPRFTVHRTPAINSRLGPVVEEPIYAENKEAAIKELRRRYKVPRPDCHPQDLLIVRGPNSERHVFVCALEDIGAQAR